MNKKEKEIFAYFLTQTWLGIPWLGLVSLCQIWDFYGYSLNTLKYPKMGIRYFFPCQSTDFAKWLIW